MNDLNVDIHMKAKGFDNCDLETKLTVENCPPEAMAILIYRTLSTVYDEQGLRQMAGMIVKISCCEEVKDILDHSMVSPQAVQ